MFFLPHVNLRIKYHIFVQQRNTHFYIVKFTFSLICMFLHACLHLIYFLCCIVQDILKAQNNNDEPSFFSKGASRFDFGQGSVGEQESLVYS